MNNINMKPKLTHASLFSGIGGAEVAARQMGWTNLFHCEINPFGRRVLEYWFPESKSYDDIKKTDFREWRGRVSVLTGGFPCFTAETPVLTQSGFVNIEDVVVGDYVLTTDQTYHPVEHTMCHAADEIVHLKAQGMFQELKCTPNHPFYVMKRKTRNGRVEHEEPRYITAGELEKGDKVGYPIHNGTDNFATPAFWKLIGIWLADGWTQENKRTSSIPQGHRGSRVTSRNHNVIICCGKKNISRLHHIIQKAGYNYTLSEDKATFRCIICNKMLCDFLQGFGKYAHGKHLTGQCFSLDNERKKALIEGWMADGYKDTNGSVKITTASERLALDMAQIARDVYRCPVSISKKTCNRKCVIEGRTVNERPQYCVTISNSDRYGFFKDGFVWCNIKSIHREKEINTVYNLSVKDEHSYNVYGIAVHNCQPFSLAGARKGAEDDRYLWPQMLRAIREIQPDWVVGENVAGITTMVEPGPLVGVEGYGDLFETYHYLQEDGQFTIERICRDFEQEGYTVQPFVIPACACGAPHRRDRVWFVAKRTDADTACDGHRAPSADGGACGDGGDLVLQPGKRGVETERTEGLGAFQESSSDGNHTARRSGIEQPEINGRAWTESESGIGNVAYSSDARLESSSEGRLPKTDRPFNAPDTDSSDRRNNPIGQAEPEWTEGLGAFQEPVENASGDRRNNPIGQAEPDEWQQRMSCAGNAERLDREARGRFEPSPWQTAFDSDCIGGQTRDDEDGLAEEVQGECEPCAADCPQSRWRNFPTQPPVRCGYDGLPPIAHSLTIPLNKWCQESIKAYGNAWVPQVAYEIFRAIEQEYNTSQTL